MRIHTVCLSFRPIRLCMYVCVYVYTYVCVCMCVCVCVCVSIYISIRLSIPLYSHMSLFISILSIYSSAYIPFVCQTECLFLYPEFPRHPTTTRSYHN